jgi:hypothetical protein
MRGPFAEALAASALSVVHAPALFGVGRRGSCGRRVCQPASSRHKSWLSLETLYSLMAVFCESIVSLRFIGRMVRS